MKRRAFTLIELMVVVALIAILSTLLIVGVSKLQTNAKRQQTVQLLENCRAMWAEYDSTARLHVDSFLLGSPGNVTLENEIAIEQQNPGYGGNRVGIATGITRAVYAAMRGQPNIRAGMDKFPASRMFLTSVATNPQAFIPFPTYGPWQSGAYYQPGAIANYLTDSSGDGEEYLCIRALQLNSDGTYTPAFTPSPPDPGYWFPICGVVSNHPTVDLTDPIFLDAWGNPVICVMGGQLTGVTAGGRSVTVSSPDGRLFWASAGPDGDFSKGDDNLYSFEKP